MASLKRGREEEGVVAQIERIADLSEEGFKRQAVMWFGKKVLPQRPDLETGSGTQPVPDLATTIRSLHTLLPKLTGGQSTQDLQILQGHLLTIKGQLGSAEFARDTAFDSVLQEVEALYHEVTDQLSARHPTKQARVMTELPAELLSSKDIDGAIVARLWKNGDIAIKTEGEKRELVFSDRLAKFLDDPLLEKILQLSKRQNDIAQVNAFTFIRYPLLGPQSISIMMQRSPFIEPLNFGNAFTLRPDQFCDHNLQAGTTPIPINKAFVSHHIPRLKMWEGEKVTKLPDWADPQAVEMCLRVVAGSQDLIETEGKLELLLGFLDHAIRFGLSEAVQKSATTRILQRIQEEKNVLPVLKTLQQASAANELTVEAVCRGVLNVALSDKTLLKEIKNQYEVLDILCCLPGSGHLLDKVDEIIREQRDALIVEYKGLGHNAETAWWMALIEFVKKCRPYVHLTESLGPLFCDFDEEFDKELNLEINMTAVDKKLHEEALLFLAASIDPEEKNNLFIKMRLFYLACFPTEGKTPDLQKARELFESAIGSAEQDDNDFIIDCFENFSKYMLQVFDNELIVNEVLEKFIESKFVCPIAFNILAERLLAGGRDFKPDVARARQILEQCLEKKVDVFSSEEQLFAKALLAKILVFHSPKGSADFIRGSKLFLELDIHEEDTPPRRHRSFSTNYFETCLNQVNQKLKYPHLWGGTL